MSLIVTQLPIYFAGGVLVTNNLIALQSNYYGNLTFRNFDLLWKSAKFFVENSQYFELLYLGGEDTDSRSVDEEEYKTINSPLDSNQVILYLCNKKSKKMSITSSYGSFGTPST